MDPAKAENLATIMETVKAVADIEFGLEFDPTLVRGMGYYTGTILRFPWKALAAPLQAADVTTS